MDQKHIITIAGKPGSGKSTTSKALAHTLGYQHFSSGDFFRALGKERGVDVLATNLLAEQEKTIDELVDQKLRELGKSEDNMVIDSRMAWHWMPYSFKVYLDLDLTVAAERILKGMDAHRRLVEHIPESTQEYVEVLQERLASESRRYKALYDANPYNTKNYDLVIDSAIHSIPQVQEIILTKYKEWLK